MYMYAVTVSNTPCGKHTASNQNAHTRAPQTRRDALRELLGSLVAVCVAAQTNTARPSLRSI